MKESSLSNVKSVIPHFHKRKHWKIIQTQYINDVMNIPMNEAFLNICNANFEWKYKENNESSVELQLPKFGSFI